MGLLGALNAIFLAGNLPFGISLDARPLLVGLRKASIGLRDYLAGRGGVRRLSLDDWFDPIDNDRSRCFLLSI